MDIVFFRSAITVLLLILFVAVCFWAWSKNRKEDFKEAAALPVEDSDAPAIKSDHGDQ